MAKFNWRIAGKAGEGIINTGKIFAKTCILNGLKVFAYSEYPSLIRGGHNYLDVNVSTENVYSHSKNVDLLIALNEEAILKHKAKAVLCDISLKNKVKTKCFPTPLKQIAEENGNLLYQNTVAIGATLALIGLDLNKLNIILSETFGHKSDKIITQNIAAAKQGWEYATNNFKKINTQFSQTKTDNNIFLSGNSAVVLGAIKAGCKFLSAYPMTPATSILTEMAKYSRDYGIIVKHTEDEIASINMAIGAGFAGVRAMTCTSGGGFALMTESLGLASQTETPLVIVESQRPGPATGLATRTGQGDLKFILNASTDEFPRVIIAPGDVNECYYLTQDAFNIAEEYQLPVIILLDKFISTAESSVHKFSKTVAINRGKIELKPVNYKRYKLTKDGISPRTFPGTKGGEHIASSYEHDEYGIEDERAENRINMHDKRFKKFDLLSKKLPEPKIIGESNNVVVSWGSTKGVVREAHKILKEKDFAYVNLNFISPFPKEFFNKLKNKNIIVVEGNKTSQLSSLISENTEIKVKNKILKYDGRPFNPEDLAEEIRRLI